MGAIGPSQFLMGVNGRFVTYNKTTGVADGAFNVNPDNFFTSVINGSSTSDPRVRYDRLTNRWFIIIINVSTPNRILIAVSDAASNGIISATTVWSFYFIPINTVTPTISNTCLMDYPTLGIDANALYIGGNNFCGASQSYNSTDGYVVRKTSLTGGGPIVVTVFRGLTPNASSAGLYTPQGVDNFNPASTEGYFIGSDNASYGTLQLRRVTNPGGTPSISGNITITVNATEAPINVPHLGNTGGTNGQLEGSDDRLLEASIRNGYLWTTHNIQVDASGVASATGGRNGTRWYQISGIATGNTPAVTQSGTVYDGSASNPISYFMPSVIATGQGHAALSMTSAGNNARINTATAGRLSTDAAGTTGTVLYPTASTTAYNPSSDPGGSSGRRWGDYSFISVDPYDDMTMWMINQFCNAANSYGCRITKLIAPPPATPALCTPNAAAKGLTSVNITLTGTVVNGSGFFDPGADPASPALPYHHISASITGGVIVNSITYNSPTSITLNINTASAALGLQNITVTNPDGQTLTGNNLLTITSALPVTTLGLHGQLNRNMTVSLSWTTSSEMNNRGFYIERNETNDMNNWVSLGFVQGAGNSNSNINYSFLDNGITFNKNYRYRLRQVDIDNHFSFSNEALIKVTDAKKNELLLTCYPNPFKSTINFSYNIPANNKVSLKIYNTLGMEVYKVVDQYQQAGIYQTTFNAARLGLSKGVYYCTLVAGEEVVTTKMILSE